MKLVNAMSAVLLAWACGAAQAGVIFQDDMAGTTGNLWTAADSNWRGVAHSGGTGTATLGSTTLNNSLTSDSSDPGTNSQRLFLGMPTAGYAGQAMLFTPTSKFGAAVTESQSIAAYDANSWVFDYYTRNDNSSTTGQFFVRLAIKVDDTWYVRNAASTLLGTVGSGGNVWEHLQVVNPFGTAGWTAMSLFDDSDVTLGLDRVATPLAGTDVLPATGMLNGMGLWGSNDTNFGLRLDLVTISAEPAEVIPEPATLVMGLLGMGGLMLVRRRAC